MISPREITDLARHVLDNGPNAIVCHRLLRDVIAADAAQVAAARPGVLANAWVAELAREQQPDGSWGRFHSMDSTLKKRFPTSETAIRRGLALGLEKDDPVLARAVQYMEEVLAGQRTWTDRVEKSDWWTVGVEAVTAGTLAQVDPAHPALIEPWKYWAEVAERSLVSGEYDERAESRAHQDLLGLKLLYLRSRYVLTLLGARGKDLPATLGRKIAAWIWNDPRGIGYLGADLKHPQPTRVFNWLESLEILSGFPGWQEVAADGIAWLWKQRNPDGLWNFGARAGKPPYFPLSEDWRRPGNRQTDHSVRVLALLRKATSA